MKPYQTVSHNQFGQWQIFTKNDDATLPLNRGS